MLTDAHPDAAPASTVELGERSSERPAPVVRRRHPRLHFAALLPCLGLIVFNLWWYWRETRPVADLGEIGAWMGREDYARAEPALRERLRRAPHDSEARTM